MGLGGEIVPRTPRPIPAALEEAGPAPDEAEVPPAEAGAVHGAVGAAMPLAAAVAQDNVPSPIARLPPPGAPAPRVRRTRYPRKAHADSQTRISSTQMTLALNNPSDIVADLFQVRLSLLTFVVFKFNV